MYGAEKGRGPFIGVWIAGMGYINDSRYSNKGNTLPEVRQRSPRQKNMLFRHKEWSIAGTNLTNFRPIAVVADQQITVKEKLFIDYGRYYMFPSTT